MPPSTPSKHFETIRGHLWMIRKFGIRAWWRYERARRNQIVVDYSQIFELDELAILGEHFEPVPWEEKLRG